MKARIIEQLGEVDVLLPSRIAEGLAANDRAKVRMSALQAVATRAGNPAAQPDDLTAEYRAAGMDVGEISPDHGFAQGAQPACGRLRRGEHRGRPSLRPHTGRPADCRSLHGRDRTRTGSQVRSSGARHRRHPCRVPTADPERHRNDRCPCPCGRRRSLERHRHLHRCS